MRILTVMCLSGLALFNGLSASEVSPQRIKEIAPMLAEQPESPGPTIHERTAWERFANIPKLLKFLRNAADKKLAELPTITDELYLEFSRNGNRKRWESANWKYGERLRILTLAECVENRGTHLPEIERLVSHFCQRRTWVMPAHDRSLLNFKQKQIDIDLGSAMFAWELATLYRLLDNKLKSATRKLIRENLEKRVFTPFEDMVKGARRKNWWLNTTNNWNAVCLAGVVGAALPVIGEAERRAFFVAAAESYIINFLNGFTPDGNCSEGLGYWNYGFGYFVMLAETVNLATGGKLRLMDHPKALSPALYGFRVHIQDGLYPAFADCRITAKPDKNLCLFINSYFNLNSPEYAKKRYSRGTGLYSLMLFGFPEKMTPSSTVKLGLDADPLRSWFPDAGIYIGRKKHGKKNRLAVALKGGHNNEHHNHNDVGTFIVAVDHIPVLCDPGGEVYTARTFSKNRYQSKVLNSFGHPVPVITGKLQRTGKESVGTVLKTAFGDEQDRVVLDIRSAYPVPSLLKLEREYTYSRKGQGSLTVTDTVAFREAQTYESALISYGDGKKNEDGSLRIHWQGKAVIVRFDAQGKDYEIRRETLDEDVSVKTKPVRVAFRLKEPVTSVISTVTITPAD